MKTILEKSGYIYNRETGIWARAAYGGIAYNDGDEIETRLADIVSNVQDLSVLSDELRPHCTDWPSLYHLGASRANILRPFEEALKDADVLEIGAGCGAITRYLGESGANVLALEGSVRRSSIARSRTRDLENVDVVCERFDELAIEHKFDVVTLIGVLEYAHQFMPGEEPDVGMLRYARRLLKPGGMLILAIENQLGLKYFAGSPEDHIGMVMYGIESRYKDDQPRTYGRHRLGTMLGASGFDHFQFMIPLPDYKLPVSIVTEAGVCDPAFDACALACQSVHTDPQLPALLSFSPELTWPAVFENGLGLEFANSFLVVASTQEGTPIDPSILAYHYSTARRPEYCKQTIFKKKSDGIKTQCQLLSPKTATSRHAALITFHPQTESDYVAGKSLAYEFAGIITRDDWQLEDLGMYFRKYISVLVQLIAQAEGIIPLENPKLSDTVPGRYMDAIPQNIFRQPSGQYHLIDTEWEFVEDIPLSRLLFRAMLFLFQGVSRFGQPAASAQSITRGDILTEIFLRIDGEEDFKLTNHLAEELAVQELVTGQSDQRLLQTWSNSTLETDHVFSALQKRDAQIAHHVEEARERDVQIAHYEQEAREYDALRDELVSMNLSYSWRMTRPLRKCLRLLKRIRGMRR